MPGNLGTVGDLLKYGAKLSLIDFSVVFKLVKCLLKILLYFLKTKQMSIFYKIG